MRRVVDVAELRATTGAHRAGRRVDLHPPLWRHVDHQPALDRAHPRAAVPRAAHGDLEPELPRLTHRVHHVRGVDAACDRSRALVDHPVVHLARGLVRRVVGADHLTSQSAGQLRDRIRRTTAISYLLDRKCSAAVVPRQRALTP
jgi:hypothetical protein